jgi:hypothetical protein
LTKFGNVLADLAEGTLPDLREVANLAVVNALQMLPDRLSQEVRRFVMIVDEENAEKDNDVPENDRRQPEIRTRGALDEAHEDKAGRGDADAFFQFAAGRCRPFPLKELAHDFAVGLCRRHVTPPMSPPDVNLPLAR